MSSLEDFYQELDARMAFPDDGDWHEFSSSSRRKASNKTAVSSNSNDGDPIGPLPTNETSKPPPQGSKEGSDLPLSSKKGGKRSPPSSARPSRKKVTISSIVSTAPAPVDMSPPTSSSAPKDAPIIADDETSVPPSTRGRRRPKASATTTATPLLLAKQSTTVKGKGKKTKPELVTPAEFARRLRRVPDETETETGEPHRQFLLEIAMWS
ncbi:hypothetical protein EI94DRAFT_939123 [Lactarius quietus]|nr:hypothetical protein EI94DRAFT_939123 [Lactarius quietus]